jgi:hypothetical protein
MCSRKTVPGWEMIKLSKSDGQVEWVMGLFAILFATVVMCAGIQTESYRATSLYMEDALAASNLAAALIDIEEYGVSNKIIIDKPVEKYEIYKSALKENLGLNDEWECPDNELISGKVNIERFIIYNVTDDSVTIIEIDEDGYIYESSGTAGNVTAPNGVAVEATGVYSEISFPVDGFFGITVRAEKGKLVDVTAN